MDLRTWGFITSPKESTDFACPSLVSLEGLMGSELENGKAPRIVIKAFFSSLGPVCVRLSILVVVVSWFFCLFPLEDAVFRLRELEWGVWRAFLVSRIRIG